MADDFEALVDVLDLLGDIYQTDAAHLSNRHGNHPEGDA